jgi:ComF family protein
MPPLIVGQIISCQLAQPQLIDISSKFKQILLPQQCVLCGASAGDIALCAACEADLPWLTSACCPVCALPSGTGDVCGACLKDPPAFDATLALLEYRFPVDAVLQRYKYSGFLAVAELAGSLLTQGISDATRPDILIPMPLHPFRLKERGFNQAMEIARVVAGKLDIPLDLKACSRTRPTKPQAGLPLTERKKNLRGVFACHAPLEGKHVALLDDVMTTGASLNELAKTVKDAGAARVECWVVARTLRN